MAAAAALSSGSSSSEDEDDDDERLAAEIARLGAALEANPADYASALGLIAAQRKTGDLDGVRAARERMARVFPLTQDIWTPWLEDEARLASTEAERRAVLALHERSGGDYLSVPLWLAYCEYAEETFVARGAEGGVDAARAVYARALGRAGLHFARGGELWASFRAFERRAAESSGAGGERVLTLFRKQLRLPMANLAAVRVEFEQALGADAGGEAGGLGGDTGLQRDHERALRGADARARFENALVEEQFATSPTEAQLAPWREYAQFEAEQKGDSRSRTLAVYERSVACWPLSLELWSEYIAFAGGASGEAGAACPPAEMAAIHARAVRNISWSGALWCGYLRAQVQVGADDDAMRAAVRHPHSHPS